MGKQSRTKRRCQATDGPASGAQRPAADFGGDGGDWAPPTPEEVKRSRLEAGFAPPVFGEEVDSLFGRLAGRPMALVRQPRREELSEEARQHIRSLFPSIAFPAPEFRQIHVADKEVPETRFFALTDANTNHTYCIVSKPYGLVRHEDVIYHALDACSSLRLEYGKEKIAIQLLDDGARMSFEIIWPEYARNVRKHHDGNAEDAICPLCHGVNTFDRFRHFTSEYGSLRLACENVMVAKDADTSNIEDSTDSSTSRMIHEHVRTAVKKFDEFFLLFYQLAEGYLTRDQYLELWKIGVGLNKSDSEKVEIMKIIGYDNATLRSVVKRCKTDFIVPMWMVHCAITQFGTHRLKGKQRQIQFNTIAGKMVQRIVKDGFFRH